MKQRFTHKVWGRYRWVAGWRHGFSVMGLCGLVIATCPVAQTTPATDPQALAQDLTTLHELMQLESRQLLAASRARARQQPAPGQSEQTPSLTVPVDDEVRLMAVYGVGQAMFAQLQIAGQAWVFMRGRPWPIGHDAPVGDYRLHALSARCAVLRQGETLSRHCLYPETGRPS